MASSYEFKFHILPVLGIFALAGFVLSRRRQKETVHPYPPGPSCLPIIGSALKIDFNAPHLTYTDWANQYGEIVYTRILGDDVILVNSERAVRALSEGQRSAIYASRPPFPIIKRFGVDFHTATTPYGSEWRAHRTILQQALRAGSIQKYQDLFMNKSCSLALLLLDGVAPEDLGKSLKTFAASTALVMTYGYHAEQGDVVVNAAQDLATSVTGRLSPEKAALIQKVPFLEYIPGFMIRTSYCRKLAAEVTDIPFEFLNKELEQGTEKPSAMVDIISGHEDSKRQGSDLTLKNAAATLHLAATENNAATLQIFILAMFLFGDKQRKAQEEIDRVVGPDRLPTYEDRESLPYIEALICESLRWHPSVPMGVPRYLTEDDVFEGCYMPKGSIVKFNAWAMSRACEDPETFKPERHLLPNGEVSPDSRLVSSFMYGNFGFGRRYVLSSRRTLTLSRQPLAYALGTCSACPGRIYADNLLWAAVVQMLATVTISRPRDAKGKEVDYNPKWEGGLTAHPKPFPYVVDCRSPKREVLLREVVSREQNSP
ncbi:cytochrome P450 [Suillus placidus]|uniref:Cytochrome P450 n=1 Tax=Suillus placidus TaxID=48579 RepID=A0A9P7A049_9AGAM|nr:cytochrome P450 [Suillus placidus]